SEDRDLCDRWLARGLRMTYAPEVVVRHAHHLTLLALWRQHYGYGRGAFRFYRARRARGAEPFRPDPAFYLKLLTHPAAHQPLARGLLLTALVAWSQAANTLGFLQEWTARAVNGDGRKGVNGDR
ncbi:MAG TPA: hypothetical protein VGV38_17750, partial [Pyrinomonadaceae bacterium]|nr:hypothetical protein [Pyrinomonadaceae bacterium]